MAELILSPIVTVVIERLSSATVEKLVSLWGVKDDLADLKDSLSSIQAVLLDAEKQQSHNKQVKLWLQRLADIVDDADDLFDAVATEGLRRQSAPATTWKKIRTSHARLKFRYKMAKEIRSVRKKMAKIAANRDDYKFVECRDEIMRPVGIERETRSFVDEKQVAGRVGEKKKLLELILNPESIVGQERVAVIPIVGMGGLGKTTLVQLVFNDQLVKDSFEQRIWVCVSDDFSERSIMVKAVESITGGWPRESSLETLHKAFRNRIGGKRYLLVLDDVWCEELKKWQDVTELLLNHGEPGSVILVTTRSAKVAMLSSMAKPYYLAILPEDDSVSLFEKIAFKGKNPSEEAVNYGKKIVQKCGGIPLAIRTVAGLLSMEPETKWSSFLDEELLRIISNDGDIFSVLRLSFNHLSPNLKHCFAYCSLFPKDYIFDVETLVALWIAQGFTSVPSDGSRDLEGVGYGYLLELVSRCFFQEVVLDKALDKVLTCKMHDLVHDLAVLVGGEKYARFDHDSKPTALEKARHISLGWRESTPSSVLNAKKVRSFIQLGNSFNVEELVFRAEVAFDFSLLRSLDLHGSVLNNNKLISISKLKHLRYLDLSENKDLSMLPTSITNLVNLQTLKLTDCWNLRELPIDIGSLGNLRHLTWSQKELLLPKGVSQLVHLQTLSYVTFSEDPNHFSLDDLSSLANLRGRVAIQGVRNGMKVDDILKSRKLVQDLELRWSNEVIDGANQEVEKTLEGLQPHQNLRALTVIRYAGVEFSDWLSSLKNLVELRFECCENLKQLSSLESLYSLRKIDVSDCMKLEYIMMDINGDGGLEAPLPVFASLQQMTLSNLLEFKGWKCSNDMENKDEGIQLLSYFPCLTYLEVKDCPELISMPLYPNVKELSLANTNQMPFEQTVTAYLAHPQFSQASLPTCSSSSSPPKFYPLTRVSRLGLCFGNITDAQYFPDWMRSFSCIETLEISKSRRFSVERQEVCWISKEGESEHQMSTGGNRISWEIMSGVRKLILDEVATLKLVSVVAQYLIALENLAITRESRDLDFSWEGLPIQDKEMFNRLKILQISSCVDLLSMPSWVFKLSSLQQLQILHWEKLESMPASLSSLTSLQSLRIEQCPILILDDKIEWEALVRLQSLILAKLPKLVTLPDGLRHVTTLQTLHLRNCMNLCALPDWIGNLSSLQELVIGYCPEIESLRSIKSLTSLQSLRIEGCPKLCKRCGSQTGEDWPNICHIPDIHIPGGLH